MGLKSAFNYTSQYLATASFYFFIKKICRAVAMWAIAPYEVRGDCPSYPSACEPRLLGNSLELSTESGVLIQVFYIQVNTGI